MRLKGLYSLENKTHERILNKVDQQCGLAGGGYIQILMAQILLKVQNNVGFVLVPTWKGGDKVSSISTFPLGMMKDSKTKRCLEIHEMAKRGRK